MLTESSGRSMAGIPWLIIDVVLALLTIAAFVFEIIWENIPLIVLSGVLLLVVVAISIGFYMIQPNQAAVLTLFGDYKGSDRTAGLRFANPLYMKKKVSLRLRNFTTAT